MALPQQTVCFGREICGDLAKAEQREWLVTNGIGGYASGTIAGSMTRRYHGLLVAALQPPLGRTQLVAAFGEIVRYHGQEIHLATHRWTSGATDPQGYVNIESFHLEGTRPVWIFAIADALLEKRVWMRQGENTTYVQYKLLRGTSALELDGKALVNYRDHHSLTEAGDWRMKVEPVEHGIAVTALDGAIPFYLKSAGASCQLQHDWFRNFFLPAENERGMNDHEDHLFAGLFHARLELGQSVTFVFSTGANAQLDGEATKSECERRETELLQVWCSADKNADKKPAQDAPVWLQQLVLAAGQFIVEREIPKEPGGRTVIAGYHWFGDWGRDTMISLPGLTLVTGRPEVARKILLAFARYVDGGMLPNNFPDAGGKPEYNTVDAALWYFEAVRQYFAATEHAGAPDNAILQTLFPVLREIIAAYGKGTRYNIGMDPADSLIYAGDPGVQLTWMDAKVDGWVVTPRIGKPVEINALWINALETMVKFAQKLNEPIEDYQKLAATAKNNFQKFWNPSRNCCYDVIDAPGLNQSAGNDALLRPNQIFAVSLPVSPLTTEQQKAVVDICAERLLTSFGLRSLAQGEPDYQGRYIGTLRARDAAYHQGTVWGWLLGPFALAHWRVYKDRNTALHFLEPLGKHIQAYGLGTLAEIFDGDAPFTPRGCIAQAWTVAEVLHAWTEIASMHSHSG